MAIDIGQVVQYGLYALTVAFGIALAIWLRREKKNRRARWAASELQEQKEKPPTISIKPAPPAADLSIATVLAGIRLPVHWSPDPPSQLAQKLTLTTHVESAPDMAARLADELARLGYRVESTGEESAVAVRDRNRLTIDVHADPVDSSVSAHIDLVDVGHA